jgi:microcystin-dependent protein
MSAPFLGEIRMFGFNFPPRGWAFCSGQLLPISQNTALFAILGTTYGGNGQTTFALPNLQGSAPLHAGQGPGLTNRLLGDTGGSPAVTLITTQMPLHNHALQCSTNLADQQGAAGNIPAPGVARRGQNFYASTGGTNPAMQSSLVGLAGGSLPHNNLPPFLTVNFCIALQGIFPARN